MILFASLPVAFGKMPNARPFSLVAFGKMPNARPFSLVAFGKMPNAILAKCYYVKDRHLRGAMVWDCGADDSDFTLSKVLWTYLKEK